MKLRKKVYRVWGHDDRTGYKYDSVHVAVCKVDAIIKHAETVAAFFS